MNEFWKAVIYSAVPIAIVGFIPVLGWILDIFFILAALVVGFGVWARGQQRESVGIFAGTGIGVVFLGVSCFALSQILL